MAQIHVSIVTPETTTFDSDAESVVVPMLDGERGILANHAPMIGRLGPGEMRVTTGGNTERFYVDGGFVQIANNAVSVLTGNSIPAAEIDLAKAREDLEKAKSQTADKPELVELKNRAIAQATAQIRMAENS